MSKDIKISSIQLSLLIMGLLFGNSAIMNPATTAHQDAWLALLISWAGGFVLMGMYVSISRLHPSMTLVGILKTTFGRFMGSIITALYIWYFVHQGSLALRSFGEYMGAAIYEETPLVFIILCMTLVIAYAVRNGLEIIARMAELVVPLLPLLVAFISFALINQYDVNNFLPFLERGILPVLKTSFEALSFPFGETVVFLMIFPALNESKKLAKVSFISVAVMGLMLLNVTIRDLMVLGHDMLLRHVFPPLTTTRLIPGISISPLIAVNLLIGGGVKISVCLYAAAMGISELFSLEDHKPFVLPISALAVSLSVWLYNNVLEMHRWSVEIWPYYSIPFQILIPSLILSISRVRRKKKTTGKNR